MKRLKITAIVLSALIFLSGCRAKPDGTSSSAEPPTAVAAAGSRNYLTMLYSAADTFNPYTAATDINRQLCRLLYEPLLKTDNSYNISYSLAQSAEVKGKECTVTLKSRYFSDGSALTADDVVYSFNLAKKSNTEYAYKLYEALSATVRDSKTVVIKLDRADPYFANTLDFPIIKKGSDTKTDSDGVTPPPIGCGRFKLNDSEDKLITNEHDPGKDRAIKEIRLINAPDSDAVGHYVEIGAADMYYSDISDGNILRMSGKKVNINLNPLIYIGVNLSNEQLSLNALRQAISSGLDRKEICRDGYFNNALPANGFFNPAWEAVKSVQNINLQANKEITVENLEEIGYNKLDSEGVRTNGAGKKLKFELLVNKENRLRVTAARIIAKRLSEYGISVNVAEKSFADYTAALSSGNFQLYLAEVAITPNMDISSLVTEGGSAAYGIKKPEKKEDGKKADEKTEQTDGGEQQTEEQSLTAAELVSGFYAGTNTLADLSSVLQTEMPVIPICYRTGVLFYNDKIENVNNSSCSDIYFSIDSYSVGE